MNINFNPRLTILCGLSCFFLIGITTYSWSTDSEKIKENPLVLSLGQTDTERPPVLFFHDMHVKTLGDAGCQACHPFDKNGNVLFTFPKNRNDKNKKILMRSYHAECIGCHKNIHKAHKKSGPVVCGKCHLINNTSIKKTDWPSARFDFHSNNLHIKFPDGDCLGCHHTGDLFSCRKCHREKDEKHVPSLRKALHASCLKCHLGYSADLFSRATCHSEQNQGLEESAKVLPPPSIKTDDR